MSQIAKEINLIFLSQERKNILICYIYDILSMVNKQILIVVLLTKRDFMIEKQLPRRIRKYTKCHLCPISYL